MGMLNKISYDAEAMKAVAEKARTLRDNVDQTRKELIKHYMDLQMATNFLELRTGNSVDFASVVSQKALREQAERLEKLVEILYDAAGLADEVTNETNSWLDELRLRIFAKGEDGKIHINPAAGLSAAVAAIGGTFGTLTSSLYTGVKKYTLDLPETVDAAVEKLADKLITMSDDAVLRKAAALGAAGNAKLLKTFGVSNDEIMKICETSGKKGLEAKVAEMLKKENEAFLKAKNAGAKTWYGSGCVKMTYAKMKHFITDGKGPQYAKGYSSSGNGKDVVSHLADTSGRTDLPFTQTKYKGTNCLKDLIASHGDPATDIVVSFPDVKSWEDGELYGHVVYIDAIVDGKVYLTDTANASKFRVYDSIDAFLNKYAESFGRASGAVHFQKNS